MFTNMKDWAEIRRLRFVEGWSKKQLCKEFQLNYRTVQKILDNPEPPGYRMRVPRAKPVIGPFLPFIREMLDEDRQMGRKQRHTSKRIFQRLREEHGYQGGKTAVYDAVQELRRESAKIFAPLVKTPGQGQFDFGYAEAVVQGKRVKIALTVFTLPFSNVRFVQAFPRECTETFQEGLKRAFQFIGGVPVKIKFDNSRIAVSSFKNGRCSTVTKEFERLESHFGFESYFCKVRQPQEKGHVENAVKFCRENFLVPIPHFDSYDEFNASLAEKCRKLMKETSARQERTIAELFEMERPSLIRLPDEEFETRQIAPCQSNNLSLVTFDKNEYSVPVKYGLRKLLVIGGLDEIKILSDDKIIAIHRRDWDKNNRHYNPLHYIPLLERKPSILHHGAPFADWVLPEEFIRLENILYERSHKDGQREYIRVLNLLDRYTMDQVKDAIRSAFRSKTYSYDAVNSRLSSEGNAPESFMSERSVLAQYTVPKPDLSVYAFLSNVKEADNE